MRRRSSRAVRAGAALFALLAGAAPATAEPSHGLSIFGDLAYPPDFQHFAYVNPEAPKGGELSHVGASFQFNQSPLTFNTLNTFILKGDAPMGMARLVFDTLMVRAHDEPDAVYGLVAETAELLDGGDRVVFRLRDGAYFHDGSPLTARDVVFSIETLKADGHPLIAQNLKEVTSVSAPDDLTVEVAFSGNQTRDLPIFVSLLPILSRAHYEARPFAETTLTPPLGSGPYEVGAFEAGRFITYERVEDYWARDLPVNAGQWNFGRIRYEYFRDRTAQFEAFKAQEYLLREEFTSRVWATEYTFPAVEDGRVKLLTLPDEAPSGAQGWFINTRREKFKDPRVRKALDHAFDFEWTNKNHFHGLYERTHSIFENSPMKAEGPPGEAELKLLEPYRSALPPEVFGEPYISPVTDGSGRDRANLRKAGALLEEAGWTLQDGKRVNEAGEQLSIEFLTDAPTFERVIQPFVQRLQRLGIDAGMRLVDSAQFQERVKNFDFDLTTRRFRLANTPGIEMRSYLGSEWADEPGSRNLWGISDPVVDALVEKVIAAETREDQIVAARALDRVLRAGHYWVPQWYKASHTLAFWDAFGRPETKPRYDRGLLRTWWADLDKQRALGIQVD